MKGVSFLDKHLKEFNFEEKINTTFTEENKKRVLGKIDEIEKKRKKKNSYFANGLTLAFSVGLLIFGFNFVSNNIEGTKENAADSNTESELILNQNGEEPTEVIATEDDEKEKEELEVGAYFDYFWYPEKLNTHEDYDYSDSNYNLYVAHLRAALITDNAIFLPGRMDYSTYKRYLDSILFYLNEIVPGEEKIEEFQMAVQLAEQAIDNEVEKGDPILDDLHMILHELDEYYNAEAFQDHITSENGIIIDFKE